LRILFVAMPGSVHTARWINQISDQDWDVRLFAATPHSIHPDHKNITAYGFPAIRPEGLDPSVKVRGLWPFRKASGMVSHRVLRFAPQALAHIIRRFKPDILHSMEIQHAGYLAAAARGILGSKFPTWVVSNWGSDIYLFGRLSEHAERVRSVVSACDYYHTECYRDVKLAQEFGFAGRGFWVLPGAGGFDVRRARQFRQDGPTSARRVLALKGYQHWAGRALVGLRAIELCADALEGYRVAVYSPAPEVLIAAELASKSTGIPVDCVPLGTHEDVLRLHGRARASIGLSISDAFSTSALEAMIMGSFPIQSDTSCINELLRDGETGILVPPNDPEPIAAAIQRAVTDDALVDHAADINARVTAEHLDQSVVRPQVVAMYQEIGAQERARGKTRRFRR
jgi:glycosyltransferase involved in cell wall biosynthesis